METYAQHDLAAIAPCNPVPSSMQLSKHLGPPPRGVEGDGDGLRDEQ